MGGGGGDDPGPPLGPDLPPGYDGNPPGGTVNWGKELGLDTFDPYAEGDNPLFPPPPAPDEPLRPGLNPDLGPDGPDTNTPFDGGGTPK